MQFVWKYIDDLVGKGFEWYIIAQLLFYASSTFVPLALPLAILLSSLMTFGNLGENYELVAMKSAGISLQKAMRPLIITAILISIGAYYFSNNVLPIANLKMGTLLYDVREQKPAVNIKEGVFYKEIDDFVIKVGKKDNDGMTIHKIIIYDHRQKNGNTNVTVAEDGKMELTKDKRFLIFSLHNGCNYNDVSESQRSRKSKQFQRLKFEDQYRRFDLASFAMTRSNEEFFKDNFQMMNTRQLDSTSFALKVDIYKKKNAYANNFTNSFYFYKNLDTNRYKNTDSLPKIKPDFLANFSKADQKIIIANAINSARNLKENIVSQNKEVDARNKQINRHEIEWHRKFTLSIACIWLFFIGAPLGAIIRKGGLGLPVVISVIFFVIYHVISMTGEKFVKEGAAPAYIGMWVAAAVYLPIGIFLTYKATTDSVIFDPTAYFRIFGKILKKRK